MNIFKVQGACSKFYENFSYFFHFTSSWRDIWKIKAGTWLQKRLMLIVSDPRISAALLILSVSKMILIYINYRLWLIKLKVIYAKVLDTLCLERNRDELHNKDSMLANNHCWVSSCFFWQKSWCIWYVSAVFVFMIVMNLLYSLIV